MNSWTVRYTILLFAIVAAVLVFGAVVYGPTPDGLCIYEHVYGIGEGKRTEPLPCEWKSWVNTA